MERRQPRPQVRRPPKKSRTLGGALERALHERASPLQHALEALGESGGPRTRPEPAHPLARGGCLLACLLARAWDVARLATGRGDEKRAARPRRRTLAAAARRVMLPDADEWDDFDEE